MPMFEYACDKCGACWTRLAPQEDEPEKCGECGSGKIRQVISNPSPPIFHGHGFHETDYKRKPR